MITWPSDDDEDGYDDDDDGGGDDENGNDGPCKGEADTSSEPHVEGDPSAPPSPCLNVRKLCLCNNGTSYCFFMDIHFFFKRPQVRLLRCLDAL